MYENENCRLSVAEPKKESRNMKTEESELKKGIDNVNKEINFFEPDRVAQTAFDLNDIFVDTKMSVARCLDEVSIVYGNAEAEAKRIIDDASQKAENIILQAQAEGEKIIRQAAQKADDNGKAFNQKDTCDISFPTKEQIIAEQKRLKRIGKFKLAIKSAVCAMLVIAAVTVLLVSFCFPVLQISGTSMMPLLNDGEIAVAVKNSDFEVGDIIAFYSNNEILVKRVICGPGDWINIDDTGTVYVNKTELNEPYVYEKSLGDCDITFPYQVPENNYFVMGDHRSVSVDSRNKSVGCVQSEQIIGRVVLRVWPITVVSWIS